MGTNIYSGLAARVLTYGDTRRSPFRIEDEYDYLADGFDASHIPDLIRVLEDDELGDADSDSPELWAQTHAWRILGMLRAEAAIEPLLQLLRYVDERDDDWVQDEVPKILAYIGEAALEPAARFLADSSNGQWARVGACATIEAISNAYPTSRDRCVELLSGQLEHFAIQSDVLNASLIDTLTELGAVEAAPLMERAFAADLVDLTLRGDWEDIQISLGLLDERITPKRNYLAEALFGSRGLDDSWFGGEVLDEEFDDVDVPARPSLVLGASVDRAKKKRKRKEAQKQRKAQRKPQKKK